MGVHYKHQCGGTRFASTCILEAFISKYHQQFKGKDTYERLLLRWYKYMEQYTTKESEVGKMAGNQLVKGWSNPEGISDEMKSCLMSSFLMGIELERAAQEGGVLFEQ